MRRAVFFDRDGTLNEDLGYIGDPEAVCLLPGAPEAVKAVAEAGFLAIIVTNQAGIARGLTNEADVLAVNQKVLAMLASHGASIDGLYYCPHHPEGSIASFAKVCDCRKPAPGMLRLAAEEHGLDLAGSYVIGDKASDVALAVAVGATGVLVRTGYGSVEHGKIQERGIALAHVADDVRAAVAWILQRHEGSL